LIKQAARQNCIPERLLAIIIANEMIDWRWPDGTGFDGIRGGGVGPAQISPGTAVNEGVTGMQTSDFQQYRQATPAGPTSADTSYTVSSYDQHISSTRNMLQTDGGAVQMAARLLSKYLSEMCGRQTAFGVGAQTRFTFLAGNSFRAFCDDCKNCDQIVKAPLPAGLADTLAAKWNTPDVWNAREPIGDHNYPNADRNGTWAEMLLIRGFDGLLIGN
jgi:hypothetical protein